ncbi:hypothetical protein JCM10449v2_002145 [Rhodotorula kratochvilovae]
MHRFFYPAFVHLHDVVLASLVAEHSTALLPLLALNRHFRHLAIEALVRVYSGAKWRGWHENGWTPQLRGGACILIRISDYRVYKGSKYGDPRWVLGPDMRNDPEFIPLLFESMDPSTLLCTFTTAGKDAIPTAWFRRAKRDDPSAHVVYGRVLAAAPDKYAVRACITEPVYPDDVGERLEKTGGTRDGWQLSYISTCDAGDFFDDMDRDGEYRLYHMPEGSGTPVEPGYCTVTSLKLPLVDLFRPPRVTNEANWDPSDRGIYTDFSLSSESSSGEN